MVSFNLKLFFEPDDRLSRDALPGEIKFKQINNNCRRETKVTLFISEVESF